MWIGQSKDISPQSGGCSVEFQQLAKNAFSKSAFPLSSETIESLLCKAGIVFI